MRHSARENRPEIALPRSSLGRSFRFFLLCLFVFFVAIPAWAFDELIDSPMYRAPATPGPQTVAIFPKEAKQLWLKAFERPGAEAETRCRVADAVVRARQRRVEGLEVFIAPFRAAVDQPDEHPMARLTMARALAALAARAAAPSLLRIPRPSRPG